jgi:hypothetical protein
MIFRGPGFLAVVLFSSYPLSGQQVVSLSQSTCVSPVQLTNGIRGEEGGKRAESYDDEKAWSSINHSRLSDPDPNFRWIK